MLRSYVHCCWVILTESNLNILSVPTMYQKCARIACNHVRRHESMSRQLVARTSLWVEHHFLSFSRTFADDVQYWSFCLKEINTIERNRVCNAFVRVELQLNFGQYHPRVPISCEIAEVIQLMASVSLMNGCGFVKSQVLSEL